MRGGRYPPRVSSKTKNGRLQDRPFLCLPRGDLLCERLAHRDRVACWERAGVRLKFFHQHNLAADEDDDLAVLHRCAVATKQPA